MRFLRIRTYPDNQHNRITEILKIVPEGTNFRCTPGDKIMG